MPTERIDMGLTGSVITAWKLARSRASAAVAWSRFRWLMLAAIVILIFMAIGGEYAIGGKHIVSTSRTYTVFTAIMPGGIRGHGVVMLAIGAGLLFTLVRQQREQDNSWRALRAMLWLAFGYFLWTAVLLGLAPTQPGGSLSWVAVTLWVILSALPLLLTFGPPPPLVSNDEVVLVGLLRDAGLTSNGSRELAERYFRGGIREVH